MALSKTEIANIALSHLGVGKDINNVDSDSSAEARAIRTYWEMAVDTVLKSWQWPFARAYAELGLVEENPVSEWGYSYRYPSDCVDIRKLVLNNNGSGISSQSANFNDIPFNVGGDNAGPLVYTNLELAVAQYTTRSRPVSMWPHDFTLSFTAQLAFLMAPRLTSRDSGQQQAMMSLFNGYVMQARSNAYNEQLNQKPPEAEWTRAREGGWS